MSHVKPNKFQQGFTLVEVIVVAIIVAALAAVAIPLYLNYVNSSRVNAASNASGSIASFCGACKNAAGTTSLVASTPTTPGQVTCSTNNSTIQIPTDIVVTITAGPPGVVTARHRESDSTDVTNTKTFNF